MRNLLKLALVLAFVCALPSHAFGLTGADLVAAGNGLDGSSVTFEGEVVSEALAGGRDHVWVNVLSGGVAVGVWMPVAMADDIGSFGTYSQNGDIVRVTGILSEACDVHGGDLDVHASEIVVLRPGTPREHPVQSWKLLAGLVGLAGAYAIVRRAWRREERPS
ncbi:MAG: hypothetical protein ACYCXR_02930 [Coriobacteriia bacterium]